MQIIKDWFRRSFSDPQVVILAVLLVICALIIYAFGRTLTPVLASLVIAYMLEGLVGFFERRGTPRLVAVLIVFLSFMAFLFVLLFALLPKLSVQLGEAISELPNMFKRLQSLLSMLPERYPEFVSREQLNDMVRALQTAIAGGGDKILSYSMASVRGLIIFLVYLVLMPLMVFFFLKDKGMLVGWVTGYLPKNRDLASQVWQEVDLQIGNYIRGKFWEILIIWAASWIVFYGLGLKFAMLIGLLVGLSVIVPYIGVTVTVIPVALMGFFQWGWSPELFYLLVAYGIIQLLDGNLLAPLLLSGVVNMHPVAIITSVLVFGGLWGFWGIFFAIPLATLVHAILRAWPRKEPEPPVCVPPDDVSQDAAVN